MTTVYFVRHAEAEGNTYRRMHGQYNSLITENGVRQIEALRARFEDIPVDACYASDLYRTCRTAQAVYIPKGLPLHPDRAVPGNERRLLGGMCRSAGSSASTSRIWTILTTTSAPGR